MDYDGPGLGLSFEACVVSVGPGENGENLRTFAVAVAGGMLAMSVCGLAVLVCVPEAASADSVYEGSWPYVSRRSLSGYSLEDFWFVIS